MGSLKKLEERVYNFIPVMPHDGFALVALKEALKAAKSGNFGVGAVLVNRYTGNVMYRGRNKVFSASRSDIHAEMDVMNTFEEISGKKSREKIKNLMMVTSLESCPMCLCRLITSGIPEVYHLTDDEIGGMVHLMDQLPPVWQQIAQGRIFRKADCSPELSELGKEIFEATVELNNKL